MAGSLYNALGIGFRAQTSAEAAVEPARTAELAMGLLRPDFESAVLPTAVPESGAVMLQGGFLATDSTGAEGLPADTVELYTTGDPLDAQTAFATTGAGGTAGATAAGGRSAFGMGATDQPAPTGDVRMVQIGLMPYGSGQVLVRRVTTNLLAPAAEEPYDEVVCRGVRSFNLRYYDGITWQDSWDSTTVENAIPSAVEVTMELVRGEGPYVRVIPCVRVFRLSCSTLTTQTLTDLLDAAAESAAGTGGTP